jgi:hypothetical protein
MQVAQRLTRERLFSSSSDSPAKFAADPGHPVDFPPQKKMQECIDFS